MDPQDAAAQAQAHAAQTPEQVAQAQAAAQQQAAAQLAQQQAAGAPMNPDQTITLMAQMQQLLTSTLAPLNERLMATEQQLSQVRTWAEGVNAGAGSPQASAPSHYQTSRVAPLGPDRGPTHHIVPVLDKDGQILVCGDMHISTY